MSSISGGAESSCHACETVKLLVFEPIPALEFVCVRDNLEGKGNIAPLYIKASQAELMSQSSPQSFLRLAAV